MNGIENIIARISEEAEKSAAQIIRRAEEEARAITEEYKAKSDAIKREISERGQKTADERMARISGAGELDARKAALARKQELISDAFEAAVKKLESLDDAERVKVLVRLALSAADGGPGEIILSKRDSASIGEKVLSGCSENKNITLSDETREIGGGLILRTGKAEVNCSFRALAFELRDELSIAVADILFG